MKLKTIAFIVCLAPFATGCGAFYSAPVIPTFGVFYTNTRAPMDVDLAQTKTGPRQGRASVTTILALFSYGDASAATAAQEGGITTIDHADYEYFNLLGIYQRFTTVVYGE